MNRIFVAPLDWGLGHASRCVPIIRELRNLGKEVIIGGHGDSLHLLQQEFSDATALALPGYSPSYQGRRGSMVLSMAAQLPRFVRAIQAEHQQLQRYIDEHRIDGVISDNRFGLYTTKVPCAFITHQCNILMPKRFGWLGSFVRNQNLKYISRFAQLWIPDVAGENSLSGKLSFVPPQIDIPIAHIGLLSRFSRSTRQEEKTYDVVAVLSGPEPQRTIFEEVLMPQLRRSDLHYFVVRGAPGRTNNERNVVDFLSSNDLQALLNSAGLVIARSGYSTVMDLAVLSRKALLVPTPQQTEQQYLAEMLSKKGVVHTVQQEGLKLSRDVALAMGKSGAYNVSPTLQYLKIALKTFVDL